MEANKISIPLRGNDALAEVLSGASTGDRVHLKDVYFTIDEATQELVTGTIEEVKDASVESNQPEPDEKDEPKKPSPVMMVMSKDRAPSDKSRDAFYP